MKHFFVILLTLSAIALASCSSEDNYAGLSTGTTTEVTDSAMQQVQRNAELMVLQNSVHELNVTTFGQKQNPNTRGLFSWLKHAFRIVATVAADAIGGVLGGIAGGVTASGIAGGAMLFKVEKFVIKPMDDATATRVTGGINPFLNIVPTGPVLKGDSIGYYHNKVMCQLFSDSIQVAEFNKKSDSEKATVIMTAMAAEPYLREHYGSDLTNTAKSAVGINVANTMMQIAEEVETEEEFFERLEASGLCDANLMGVLREILEGLNSIDVETDDGSYYEAVLEIINNSELDEVTKQCMEDGVVIGQASNRLWKVVAGGNYPEINTGLRPFDPNAPAY